MAADNADTSETVYYVLRHRGQRVGERVRVVFESRSREEAERYYLRKAFPKRGASFGGMEYATTILCTDPYRWTTTKLAISGWPYGADFCGVVWEGRVTAEREAREARREARMTRKARRRVVVEQRRVRVMTGVRVDVTMVDDAASEHEAVAVEQAAEVSR